MSATLARWEPVHCEWCGRLRGCPSQSARRGGGTAMRAWLRDAAAVVFVGALAYVWLVLLAGLGG